ncbi:MAG: metal-dependent hydrolase [Acidobacteria bacterium]|nr:metal-dependent hydrolase [Acidobacteriota bacterium]
MIPASHLLTGFLAGRAIRLTSDAAPPKRSWLDPLVVMAMGAALVPDLDVVPGLMNFAVSGWHRGATHSLVGILTQALLITVGARLAWMLVFSEVLSWGPLFRAALAGLATHVFWDYLNPWGVALLWPLSEERHLANLIHEGDVFVLAALAAGSALVATRRYRAGFVIPVLVISAYALLQFQWSLTIKEKAGGELSSDLIRVYPNAQIGCPWLVLARFSAQIEGPHIEAYCVSVPLSGERRLALREPLLDDPRITASAELRDVRKFNAERPFAFAELRAQADGSATVIWRDLREAVFQPQAEQPFGYYVHFSPGGRLTGHEHEWFLLWWFW